jgi:membrane protease YdiL (CAAX protease family)
LRGGPFLEEFGWRGFALPRMQRQFGPLGASLLLGVLWAFWHSPFFLPGGFTPHGASLLFIGLFVLVALASTMLMTWVFNHTQGSLLLAFLAHDSIDAAADFLLPMLFLAPIGTTPYPP